MRLSLVWNACSTMLFTGANPVAPATKMIGFVPSSRRKKEPTGPSKRTRSPTRIASNTWVVNRPPGIRRTCSSMGPSSWGAVAKEKLRFWPSSSRMLMYWPA